MGTEPSEELWSAVLGIFSVVRGLVGGLGRRCRGQIVGQDKASTVSHGAPPRFRSRLESFSHRARTARTVRTPLAEGPRFEAFSAPIQSLSKLLSFAAASTILIAALGFVPRKSGVSVTLTVLLPCTNLPAGSRANRAMSWSKAAFLTGSQASELSVGYIGSLDCSEELKR